MLRCHILPVARRKVNLLWQKDPITVLSVHPLEIFAAKIVALLNRTAPRDLYDVYNVQKYGLFDETEKPLLRKCAIFYSAIAGEKAPDRFAFDNILVMVPQRIKTDLIPVLRRGEHFDLKTVQKKTIEYLSGFLILQEAEIEFWQAFNRKEYRPELVFSNTDCLERIAQHPMALWKCGGREKSG